jgi:hypothetical protein
LAVGNLQFAILPLGVVIAAKEAVSKNLGRIIMKTTMKHLSFLILLFATFSLNAQSSFISETQRLHFPSDFVQTSDHGYLIGGQMNPDTINVGLIDEFALLKLDSLGNQHWIRLSNDGGHDCWITSVFQCSDGNYIYCGVPDGMITHEAVMVKVNSFGNLIWSKKLLLPGFHLYDFSSILGLESRDGNYIAAFLQYGTSSYLTLIKFTPGGSIMWEKNFNDSVNHIGGSGGGIVTIDIANTNDSGFIITGGNDFGGILIHTDSSGQLIWNKMYYDSLLFPRGTCVKQTFDGGYILSAAYSTIIKTDMNGDAVWTKTLGGYEYYQINSVIQTSDSNFVISGKLSNINPQYGKFFLLKIDNAGDTIWSRTYSVAGDNLYCLKTIEDVDSGLTSLCVQGNLYSSLYKMDKNGIINCNSDTSSIILVQSSLTVSSVVYDVDTIRGIATGTILQSPYSTPTLISCSSLSTNLDLPSLETLTIFPNPVSNSLHIEYQDQLDEISIYGLAGNLMITGKNKTDIDVSSLEPGMYYLILKSKSGIQSRKFIKS